MKFFIDTANLEQIRKAHELGVLDGATTNPSLMAKENIRGTENCNRHYVEICNIVEGDVSAEVIATDFEGMVREGEVLWRCVPPVQLLRTLLYCCHTEPTTPRPEPHHHGTFCFPAA